MVVGVVVGGEYLVEEGRKGVEEVDVDYERDEDEVEFEGVEGWEGGVEL